MCGPMPARTSYSWSSDGRPEASHGESPSSPRSCWLWYSMPYSISLDSYTFCSPLTIQKARVPAPSSPILWRWADCHHKRHLWASNMAVGRVPFLFDLELLPLLAIDATYRKRTQRPPALRSPLPRQATSSAMPAVDVPGKRNISIPK